MNLARNPVVALLAGIVLAGAAMLTLGSAPPQAVGQGVRIEYGPLAKDMVRVVEGTPFIVPAGKIFVCTGLGVTSIGDNTSVRARFNDVDVLEHRPSRASGGTNSRGFGPSIGAVPPGLSAPAGTSVSAFSNESTGVVLGYVAND